VTPHPMSTAPQPVPAPAVTDWAALPLVLKASHMARLFDLSRSGLYARLEQRPDTLPPPLHRDPLEWSRAQVQTWIERRQARHGLMRRVS
jgi:predicted DNA-binding transcriptional regulator AlpA